MLNIQGMINSEFQSLFKLVVLQMNAAEVAQNQTVFEQMNTLRIQLIETREYLPDGGENENAV